MLNTLYRVREREKAQVVRVLAEAFQDDPLYKLLIPDDQMRRETLPETFEKYFDMVFPFSSFYADSPEINGVIALFDGRTPYRPWAYRWAVTRCTLRTAWALYRHDRSLGTIKRHLQFLGYLKSTWVEGAVREAHLHVDLFAVRRDMRGQGVGSKLMAPVLALADGEGLSMTLETHNLANVEMYRHFGFALHEQIQGGAIQQFCMVRHNPI